MGSPTETQRAGDSASLWLPLLQWTWALLGVFLLVCLRLGRHLLMAKVCSREKAREKLPEICPPPLPRKASQSQVGRQRAWGVTTTTPPPH